MAGGAGLSPIAPGTVGSLVAVVLFLGLGRLPLGLYLLTWLALLALAIWSSEVAERSFGTTDDGRIVIDEVVGQLAALAPLLGGRASFSLLVTGFVAFRVFDVWKPGPVGRAERNLEGGLGVVMDDVLAGVLAGLVLCAVLLASLALGSGDGA